MSITLKPNSMKYRDPDDGTYKGVDVVAERTTSEQVADIEAEGTVQKDAVIAAGQAAQSLVPDQETFTNLSNDLGIQWAANTPYEAGAYVMHNYKLYRRKVATEGDSTFSEDDWDTVSAAGEITNVNNALDDVHNALIGQYRKIDVTPDSWVEGGITSSTGSTSTNPTRVRTSLLRGSCDAFVIEAPTNFQFAVFAYVYALGSASYVGVLQAITPVDAKGKMIVPVTKGLAYVVVCGYTDNANIAPNDVALASVRVFKTFDVSSEQEIQAYNYGMSNSFKTNGRPFMWERGSFGDTSGSTLNSEYYIRTVTAIPVAPGVSIKYSGAAEENLAGHVYFYDKDNVFMFRIGYIDTAAIAPSGAASMKITYGHTTASGVTVTDGFDMVNKFSITVTNDTFARFLEKIGYIPFNLAKGYWRSNGTINASSTGISCSKLLELPLETKIKVLIRGPWVYTVMQGDERNNLTRTDRLVNYDEITTTKAFVGITFYKQDGEGSYIDVQPTDFDNNVMLFVGSNTTARESEIHDVPENIGVLNVINRAYQMAKLTYAPVANLPTQVDTDTYPGCVPEGVTVEGVMYSSVRNEGLYVPQCVSLDSYMTALKNPHSYIYTKTEPYPHYNALTYYGAVCSSMVAWCYGILDVVPTTISFISYPGMEEIEDQSPYGLKLGDMLNSPSSPNHIVIITDIVRNNRGVISKIEVTEQVNYASHPMTRRTYRTPSQMYSLFFNNGYTAYHYHYIYKVPYSPSPWVNLDNEAEEPTWNTNLSPRRGDKANWRPGETVEIDITDATGYTYIKLFKGDVLQSTDSIPSGNLIQYSDLAYGSYKVCLSSGATDSDFVYFNIIDTTVVYTPIGSKQVKVSYASENGMPSSICFCEAIESDTDYKAVRGFHVLSDAEVSAGEATVTAPETEARTDWLMKVMFKTNFGLYSSDLTEVSVN